MVLSFDGMKYPPSTGIIVLSWEAQAYQILDRIMLEFRHATSVSLGLSARWMTSVNLKSTKRWLGTSLNFLIKTDLYLGIDVCGGRELIFLEMS